MFSEAELTSRLESHRQLTDTRHMIGLLAQVGPSRAEPEAGTSWSGAGCLIWLALAKRAVDARSR